MAKQRQTVMDGCEDVVPDEVRVAADKYLANKRAIAKLREKGHDLLDTLIGQMKEHDIVEFLIDDGEKKLILKQKDLVEIKARKKEKKKQDANADGEEGQQ